MLGMVVEYKSTSASALNSTNTALGVVGMATLYDANEPDFTSIQEGLNYIGAQSCSPAQSMLHFVECARGQNPLDRLYTRTGDLSTDQDLKFYDMGKINIFTSGMQQANVTIGQLWVSYDIELSKPKLPSGGSTSLAPVDVFYNPSVGNNNINLSGKLNGIRDDPDISNIGSYMINNTVYFPVNVPRGRYMIQVEAAKSSANSTGSVLATGVTPTNCNLVNALPSGTGTNDSSFKVTSTTGDWVLSAATVVEFYNPGVASVTFDGVLLQGTSSNVYNVAVFVSALPPLPTKVSQATKIRELQSQMGLLMQQFKQIHEIEFDPSHGSTEIVASK